MRCPLCGGPLHLEEGESGRAFACKRGHTLTPDQLHDALSTRVSSAVWMAIEALETEAEAARLLGSAGRGERDEELVERAEADARLLRRLASTHPAGDADRSGVGSDRLEEAVRAVGQFLVADVPLGTTLQRIAELARDALPQALAVGVTLMDEQHRPTTAVFTDEVAPAVDAGQYEEGDGPCLAAFRDGRIVRVDDTREVGPRWSRFREDAVEHGVLSTLSFPLAAGDEVLGGLNLYARTTGAFTDDDETAASLFVTQASVVLANARAYWEAFELASGLEHALHTRAVIEQAKGKIMAGNGCTADEAFEILVRASQRENLKLRDIARRIVDGAGTVGD